MQREGRLALSTSGPLLLNQYEQQQRSKEDLTAATIGKYGSDLYYYVFWYESMHCLGREGAPAFHPEAIATPTITDYRIYLQEPLRFKPNTVNRAHINLKRYFAWLLSTGYIKHDSTKVVKLVGEEVSAPLHLDKQEELALVAAETKSGSPRDRVNIVLLLHPGFRARELCTLTLAQLKLGRRNGTISVYGKGNKYRVIPLDTTARYSFLAYDPSLTTSSDDPTPLFLSDMRRTQLMGRGLDYLVKKYAERAHLSDVSPHHLHQLFGYRMAASIPLHRLAQLMGHNSLDTTMHNVQATKLICNRTPSALPGDERHLRHHAFNRGFTYG